MQQMVRHALEYLLPGLWGLARLCGEGMTSNETPNALAQAAPMGDVHRLMADMAYRPAASNVGVYGGIAALEKGR